MRHSLFKITMKSKKKIRILNPLPGEAQFTSEKRAESHVRRGIAEMRQIGTLVGLFFIHSLRGLRRERRDSADYWASQRRCISWSGDAGDSARLLVPGEVRS